MSNLKFSIITVCYNAELYIKKTIESVLNQDYIDFEYIIIDGKSNDSTIDIIKKYAYRDRRIKFVSEKDKGIYDAMNKGINLSDDGMLYFLNAGDTFYDNKVLSNINNQYSGEDIIYGDIVVDNVEKISTDKLNKMFLIREKMICHQAIFSKKEVFKVTGIYDTNYRYCSDRKWLMRAVKNKCTIRHVRIKICNYDSTGISSQKSAMKDLYNECSAIVKEEFGTIAYIMLKIKRLLGLILKGRRI